TGEAAVEVAEWIRGRLADLPSAFGSPAVDAVTHEPPCLARLGAEKGVAGPGFSAHHRFEEEAERRSGEWPVRRGGRIRVEEELAVNRYERSIAREGGELLESWVERHMGLERRESWGTWLISLRGWLCVKPWGRQR